MLLKQEVLDIALSQFKLDVTGDHGPLHWDRVYSRGLEVAAQSGGDAQVVMAFAYLHDCCREDEMADPAHGIRAGKLVAQLRQTNTLRMTDVQYGQLLYAVKYHNDSSKDAEDVTVMCCWDADRLDLGRVGISPSPHRMKTAVASAWALRMLRGDE